MRLRSPGTARIRGLGLLPGLLPALLLALAACGGDDSAAAATPGRAGGAGGRGGAPVVVLAASDIAPVTRGPIEVGVAVTGDLRPIETIEVRSRIEGDLTSVYAREGERVRAGQLLARFEGSEQESERQSAIADREAARAALSTAQWNLEQSEELLKAGAVPEQDVRSSRDAVATARARLSAAEARVRATSITAGDTRIVAPTAGTIERRHVQPGERVAPGAALFTLVRSDVLELAAAVPARFATDVRTGQQVRFVADGRNFEGRVARVSPTVDPQTRAVTVYVQVPNANGSLKGNTFASGRVIGRTVPDAVLVPLPAVRELPDGAGYYVFRVAQGALQRTSVTLGVMDESREMAEVASGLQADDRVVVGNVGTLGDKMKVQIVGEGPGETAARGAGGAGSGAGTPAAAPGTATQPLPARRN